jgi:hypothetical protein
MKLVTVRASFDYVIVVDDSAEYENEIVLALNNLNDAARDLSVHDWDVDVYDYEQVKPNGWDDDCIPYGGDGNTRTSEYLTKEKQ